MAFIQSRMVYSYCSYSVVVLLVQRTRITRIACTLVRVILVLRVLRTRFRFCDFNFDIEILKGKPLNPKTLKP